MVLGKLARRLQRLEPLDVDPPGAFDEPAGEVGDVVGMAALLAAGQFEVFGDAFVEPQRHAGHDGVHIAVGRLVPEILGDSILPRGEDGQPRVGLDEERPPHRKARKVTAREGVVAFVILKEIEVHRLVGDRQIEPLTDVDAQGLELAHQTMLLGERKVGPDHELSGEHLRPPRQLGSLRPARRRRRPRERRVGKPVRREHGDLRTAGGEACA